MPIKANNQTIERQIKNQLTEESRRNELNRWRTSSDFIDRATNLTFNFQAVKTKEESKGWFSPHCWVKRKSRRVVLRKKVIIFPGSVFWNKFMACILVSDWVGNTVINPSLQKIKQHSSSGHFSVESWNITLRFSQDISVQSWADKDTVCTTSWWLGYSSMTLSSVSSFLPS